MGLGVLRNIPIFCFLAFFVPRSSGVSGMPFETRIDRKALLMGASAIQGVGYMRIDLDGELTWWKQYDSMSQNVR